MKCYGHVMQSSFIVRQKIESVEYAENSEEILRILSDMTFDSAGR